MCRRFFFLFTKTPFLLYKLLKSHILLTCHLIAQKFFIFYYFVSFFFTAAEFAGNRLGFNAQRFEVNATEIHPATSFISNCIVHTFWVSAHTVYPLLLVLGLFFIRFIQPIKIITMNLFTPNQKSSSKFASVWSLYTPYKTERRDCIEKSEFAT